MITDHIHIVFKDTFVVGTTAACEHAMSSHKEEFEKLSAECNEFANKMIEKVSCELILMPILMGMMLLAFDHIHKTAEEIRKRRGVN